MTGDDVSRGGWCVMAQETAIGWTDVSWNPVFGCSKVSPGCAHCYAETLALRFGQSVGPWTPGNAERNVVLKPHKLREPLSNAKEWRGLGAAAARAGMTDGKLVFVNSMSDLFHEQVPDDYIARVFAVMALAPQHTFQVLTKRPERMREWFAWHNEEHYINRCGTVRNYVDWLLPKLRPRRDPMVRLFDWPLPNVWLGVSIENRRFVSRADDLRATPAAVRFISAEPLLGPLVPSWVDREFVEIDGRTYPASEARGTVDEAWWEPRLEWPDAYDGPALDLTGIDWAIIGGESGATHRPMRAEWARDLRDECRATGTAFYFKQWGGRTPMAGGRLLDGRTWDEMPQVAERPENLTLSTDGRTR